MKKALILSQTEDVKNTLCVGVTKMWMYLYICFFEFQATEVKLCDDFNKPKWIRVLLIDE